jgi:hypothetical protein
VTAQTCLAIFLQLHFATSISSGMAGVTGGASQRLGRLPAATGGHLIRMANHLHLATISLQEPVDPDFGEQSSGPKIGSRFSGTQHRSIPRK